MKTLRVFVALAHLWGLAETTATATTTGADDLLGVTQQAAKSGDRQNIPLTKGEEAVLSLVPPTTTVTWYVGNHEEAARTLRDRIDAILTQNPWLTGKYRKVQGRENLLFSSSSRLYDLDSGIFAHIPPEDSSLHPCMPYDDLVRKVTRNKKLALRMQRYRRQPFWRVTVIPCCQDPDNKFAVCVSLSHGVGDGYCFYSLHNMLLGGEPIRAMTPERIATTQQQQEDALGKAEARYGYSLGVMVGFLRGMLKGLFATRKRQVGQRILAIDADKLTQLKEKETKNKRANGVPFVSTNDVMTSWFLANSESKHGLMAMNLRGKLEGHSKDHAFNAEADMYYRCPDDVATPALIRKSLLTLKRAATVDTPFDSWELASGDCCFVTNLSAFARLASCCGQQLLVHLPIYDMKSMMPPNFVCVVIFQPRPDELAVLLGATPKKLSLVSKMPFAAKHPFEFIPTAH